MKSCPVCETAYPNDLAVCSKDGAVLVPNAEREPGAIIRGKYRIVRTLGHGGMGTVYLAEHMLLGRLRALKFILGNLAHDIRFVKRFRQEAQTAVELRHPNIVEVVDLDQAEDGTPYIAMEFVDGPDLRTVLQSGALPIDRAIAIARGVALGLGAAHARGIVHRDLKPENILLTAHRRDATHPKLADFGIAAINDAAGAISRTSLLLTPEYASPEQWRGTAVQQLDGRTDLYALGCVLYEMLTGRNPFQAEDPHGWMHQHLEVEPPRPSMVRPEVAEWAGLDEAVLRLLAKNRDRRTPSAIAAFDALQALRRLPHTDVDDVIVQRTMRFKHPERPARLERPPAKSAPSTAAADETEQTSWQRSRGIFIGVIAAAALLLGLAIAAASIPAATLNSYGRKLDSPSHPGLAMMLYHVACSRGSGQACASMGLDYEDEAGGDFDPEQAAQFFSRACADEYLPGCVEAGRVYERGRGVQQNLPRAVEFYSRACTLSDPEGCASLGRMYEQGSGVDQDYGHAVALFAQSCESANRDGCEGLARSYRDGHGVDRDPNMAATLFEKAETLTRR
ncbi:serine/threonine-protein kinase [Occallatibacter riparius]|uniref:Serine/threonine-protein kinase n=1 Tax=Occallatibacter riparius TaxID=1002689 RepID=A0A9J7BKR2_9BACT|nr:serine/threonine-protein kinase [Occallatibacter riparius]UWZ82362.1 serine/threonine-protein kinase [Occallatibacter riparius]